MRERRLIFDANEEERNSPGVCWIGRSRCFSASSVHVRLQLIFFRHDPLTFAKPAHASRNRCVSFNLLRIRPGTACVSSSSHGPGALRLRISRKPETCRLPRLLPFVKPFRSLDNLAVGDLLSDRAINAYRTRPECAVGDARSGVRPLRHHLMRVQHELLRSALIEILVTLRRVIE